MRNNTVSRLIIMRQASPAIALAMIWIIVGCGLFGIAITVPKTHQSMGPSHQPSHACITIMQVVLGFIAGAFTLAGTLVSLRLCYLLVSRRMPRQRRRTQTGGCWVDEWLIEEEEEDIPIDDEESALLEESGVGDIYDSAAKTNIDAWLGGA